jgi:hypothetical protein
MREIFDVLFIYSLVWILAHPVMQVNRDTVVECTLCNNPSAFNFTEEILANPVMRVIRDTDKIYHDYADDYFDLCKHDNRLWFFNLGWRKQTYVDSSRISPLGGVILQLVGYGFIFMLYGMHNCYVSAVKVKRQADDHEFYEWYWDEPVTSVNQRGERLYWLVRHYANGRRIKGKKYNTLAQCYDKRCDFERQSFSGFNLSGLKLKAWPFFSNTYFWQCLAVVMMLIELKRTNAPTSTYATFLCSKIVEIAGPRMASGAFDPQIQFLLKIVTNKSLLPHRSLWSPSVDESFADYDTTSEISLEEWDHLTSRRTRSLSPRPLSRGSCFTRQADPSNSPNLKDYHFGNIMMVGSCIFALATIPDWTSISSLQDHLFHTIKRNKTISGLNSMIDIAMHFARSCYSLLTSLVFAIKRGDYSLFFGAARGLRSRYDDILITQNNLGSLLSEDTDLLPHKNIFQYEIAIVNLLQDITTTSILPDDEAKRKISALKSFRLELETGKFANLPRKSPITFCVYGGSGIGKSYVADLLFAMTAKVYDLPIDGHVKSNVYVHNASAKHFDACESWHWGYYFDDIGRENPKIVTGEHNSANAILDVTNNAPFKPVQAAVEKKGKVICRPRVCVLTTNNKELNAHVFASCPVAIARRVHYYISPKPIPEVMGTNGMLDSEKIRDHISNAKTLGLDVGIQWTWSVEVVDVGANTSNPILGDKTIYRKILSDVSWKEFSGFIADKLLQHDSLQDSAIKSMFELKDTVNFCRNCRKFVCECDPNWRVNDEEYISEIEEVKQQSLDVKQCTSYLTFFFRRKYQYCYNYIVGFFESRSKNWRAKLISCCDIPVNYLHEWRLHNNVQFVSNCSDYRQQQLLFNDGVRVGNYPANTALCVNLDFDHNLIIESDKWTYYLPNVQYVCMGAFVMLFTYISPMLVGVILGAMLAKYEEWIPVCVKAQRLVLGWNRSCEFVKRNHVYLLLGALVVAINFIAIMPRYPNIYPQGATMSAEMPKAEKKPDWWSDKPCPNAWIKEGKYTQQILTAKGGTGNHKSFLDSCRRNVLKLEIHDEKGVLYSRSHCFAINNSWIACNAHSIDKYGGKMFLTFKRWNSGAQDYQKVDTLHFWSCYKHKPHEDLYLIYTNKNLGVKDLSKNLTSIDHTSGSNICIINSTSYKENRVQLYSCDFKPTGASLIATYRKGFHHPYWIGANDVDTRDGDCGTVYASQELGQVYGIHGGVSSIRSNAPKIPFAVPIFREWLDEAIGKMPSFYPPPLHERQVQVFPETEDLVDNIAQQLHVQGKISKDMIKVPNVKNPTTWLEPQNGMPVCSVTLYNQQHTSEMRWLPTKDFWYKHGISTDKLIPNLKAFYRSSYAIGIQEINLVPEFIPQAHFAICADHYFKSVLDRLPANWKDYLGVLDFNEVVHGVDDMDYIDHINYNTSAGFPWYRSKISLGFSKDEHPVWMQERVKLLEDHYATGDRFHPIFCSHLKDEFVSPKKYTKEQLRVFVGSPVDFTILIRKFFLSFVRCMQKFRLQFESAVSIAAQGPDWTELIDHMWSKGFIYDVDGDYKAYDKGMHQFCCRLAAHVIMRFCSLSGKYNSIQLSIMNLILEDIYDSLVEYDGTITFFSCMNPSGHPLTVHFNCIVNSIYIRYCYFSVNGGLDNFNRDLRCVTYGDDNWISVRDGVNFNHKIMKDELGKIGIVYTNAQKDEREVIYTPREQVTFLKRSILPCDLLTNVYGRRMYTAPLEINSIHKMLIGSKSGNSDEIAMKESFSAALNEICLHGKVEFDNLLGKILICCQEFNLFAMQFDNYYQTLGKFFPKILESGGSYLAECETVRVPAAFYQTGNGIDFTRQSYESGWVPLMVQPPASNFMNDTSTTEEREYPQTNPNVNRTGDSIGDIAQIFSRDIKIINYTLLEGAETTQLYYPWDLYFQNAVIRSKVNNFSKVRGNLHLTFLINANPFKYGAIMAAYKPLVSANYTVESQYGCEVRDQSGGAIDNYSYLNNTIDAKSLMSLRQNIMIYPQETTKAEMILPFIHYNEYIPLVKPLSVDSSALRCMGKLDIRPLLPLATATTASANPITIEVFARLEDWDICGPSIQQQSDEYDPDKPISSVASAISRAAGALSSIPIIGPYATATSYVTSKLGDIARWFGFSNPVNLIDINPVKMVYSSRWADTEARLPLPKLALDPKNELTIDPRTVGLGDKDDMLIENIVNKPFFVGATNWECADNVDLIIQSGAVTPSYHQTSSFNLTTGEALGVVSKCLAMAPSTHLSQNFQHWAGDMVIKFKIVCSKFHRGRLRFVYDPAGEFVNFSEGAIYSRIIDLSQENELSITVPWQGIRSKLSCFPITYGSTPGQIFAERGGIVTSPETMLAFANGYWRMQVMTELSAPFDASAYVMTWVSFKNMCYSQPIRPFPNTQHMWIAPTRVQRQSEDIVPASGVNDKVDLMIDGESVVSLRQLCHRWGASYHNCSGNQLYQPVSNAFVIGAFRWLLKRFPLYYGPADCLNPYQSIGGTMVGFAEACESPLTYLTPCFTLRRGAINWRIFPKIEASIAILDADTSTVKFKNPYYIDLACVNNNQVNATTSSNLIPTPLTTDYTTTVIGWNRLVTDAAYGGMELVRPDVQQLECSCPDYGTTKGKGCNQYLVNASQYTETAPLQDTNIQGDLLAVSVLVKAKDDVDLDTNWYTRLTYNTFVCGGADYNLMGYLNPPTMYLLSGFP